MKELKDVTCCVIDRGTFFPVSQRLARDYKKVYYHIPNGESFETFAQCMRGDGHPDVTLLPDFWPYKTSIDLFVFPDCADAGLQIELESQGFPVWGTKGADVEEKNRGQWLRTCKDLGLPMPKTHVLRGITALRLFLRENEGETYFVKISRFRGDMETWKTADRSFNENKLDCLAMKFGPFKELIPFYAQEPVDTELEGGADTYFVAGQYPDKIIQGYEKKGESYFATWLPREEMPEEIWSVSERIKPLLSRYDYCNTVSTEVRVVIDGDKRESLLLDPCFRFPSPAGEEELEMYENFGEIVYRGALGEMVQPKMAAKFCGEAIIQYVGDKEGWKSLAVPADVRQWVKLYACGYADEAFHFNPAQDTEAIGCIVGLGDTPQEVIDALKDIREELKDCPVNLRIEPLVELFEEIEKAKTEGIQFSAQAMPDPEDVVT